MRTCVPTDGFHIAINAATICANYDIDLQYIRPIGGLLAASLLLPHNPFKDPNDTQSIISALLLLGVAAVMSFLGAKTANNALYAAHLARGEAEQAAQALGRANADLETTIAERTAELQSALTEVQARADAQDRLLAEVALN
jgi:rsbT co-antagonist protein RsbR